VKKMVHRIKKEKEESEGWLSKEEEKEIDQEYKDPMAHYEQSLSQIEKSLKVKKP
jgi:hypothetical protein